MVRPWFVRIIYLRSSREISEIDIKYPWKGIIWSMGLECSIGSLTIAGPRKAHPSNATNAGEVILLRSPGQVWCSRTGCHKWTGRLNGCGAAQWIAWYSSYWILTRRSILSHRFISQVVPNCSNITCSPTLVLTICSETLRDNNL